jgi:hypothetical protein
MPAEPTSLRPDALHPKSQGRTASAWKRPERLQETTHARGILLARLKPGKEEQRDGNEERGIPCLT